MEKLSKKVRRKGYLKIIFAILVGLIVMYCLNCNEDIELAGKITCTILWSIVFVIYLISGIQNIKNCDKNIKEYIQKSDYSKQQLDTEFNNSKSFSNLYVGDTHVFAIGSDAPYIIPIRDIQRIYYKHLGANPAKGRKGYYYLYLKGEKINNNIKVYFIYKTDLKKAMDYLLKIKNKIKLE